MTFHAISAARDPQIAAESRRLFFTMMRLIRDQVEATDDQTRDFMARGMLINSAPAMRMAETDDPDERAYLSIALGPAAAEVVTTARRGHSTDRLR